MGKYRGADGWMQDDSVGERPNRVPNVDPVHHGKAPKLDDGGGCASVFVAGLLCAVVLLVATVGGVFHKLLSWLWS